MLPTEEEVQRLATRILTSPEAGRSGAHHLYRFFLGLTTWIFVVSGHSRSLHPDLISLREDGRLLVRVDAGMTRDLLKAFGAARLAPTDAIASTSDSRVANEET
jgi:hypothetical protein